MEDLSKEETNQNLNDLPGNEIDNSTSNQIGIVDEPTVGMLFNSETDVYSYYSTYARNLGFSIAKRSKKVGDEGEVKYFALECSRAGKRQSNTQNLKPRLSTKTMCQARLRASLQKDGKFRLTTVSLEHNHDLSPRKARYFRCNKTLDNNVKRRLELNDEAGISVCKNFNSLVIEAGSYDNLTFGEKDCRNYIDKARRLRLGIGDGEAIKNYFQRMQESNSNSFYLMDLDDESRVKNVFWADARSREAYKAFGDVISWAEMIEKYDLWAEMIEKYDLSQNEWLKGLYEEKHRWVPIYFKDTFWAGMSTTQRSESMNAFFDGYVNSKTTLKQFVEQYDSALKNKIEKEKQADFHSFNCVYECLTIYPIERQFQEAYTNAKFKEFQAELKKLIYCNAQVVSTEGAISKYIVTEAIQAGDKLKSLVLDVYFNEEEFEVKCLCHLFEFRGIMCVHSLSVLFLRKVEMVPPKYILKRWRKDLKRGYTFVTTNYNNISCEPSMLRYDKMCADFFEVGKIAADSEDKCDLVLSNMRELKTMLLAMDGFKSCESENNLLKESSKVYSHIARKRKGRPPSKRKVSNVEKAVQQVRKKKMKQVQQLTNMNRKKVLPDDESSPQVCSPIGVEDH